MTNTLLTPQVIAREALDTLYAQTVMLPLVHTDHSAEFTGGKVGDTVTIRKPATFTAQEFTGTISTQDIAETSTSVTLSKHLDVSIPITSKELTLSLDDLNVQVLAPAMEAFAQAVDALLLGLYVDVYNTVGTAGTTPDGIDDITGCGRVLNLNKVPMLGRNLVVDPYASDKFEQIATFHEADKVGDAGTALREASLGRKFGFDIAMGQNVATHSNGTLAVTGTLAINGAVSAGASTIAVDATGLTGTWKKGSLFTIAGDTQVYVVTADATAASNAIASVAVAPAIAGGAADNAAITRIAGHTANLAFHRNAFAFVSRPLALPLGVGAGQAEIVNYKGLSLRAVSAYNATTKTDTISLDMLCGVKTLDPKRAVRLLG